MLVLVKKHIDSESLGRIVNPGEIVDLPIEPDSVLFERGYVEPSEGAPIAEEEIDVEEEDI
jgi:hypothetical protein